MKTSKLLIITEEYTYLMPIHMECDMPKETMIKLVQKDENFKNQKVLDVADANTHHICKYCGEIAEGTDENVLCTECREIFGHTFYSEL